MGLSTAAVVGLGTMGAGSAEMLAALDLEVRAYDRRIGRPVRSEIVIGSTIAECVSGVDIVFEAASEDVSVKRTVLQEIAEASGDAVIASTTSSLSATDLASFIDRPSRFLLVHFFNPAGVVPLVEVTPTVRTDPRLVEMVLALLRDLGKNPVVVGEVQGYVANRLQAALLREAFSLIDRGLVTAEGVDAVVRYGLGPRWSIAGPLGIADLGGLDVFDALCAEIFPTLDDSRESPRMLNELVAAGRSGLKSGCGVYAYDQGEGQRALSTIADLFHALKSFR